MYNFRSLPNKFPSLIFAISLTRLNYFSVSLRKGPKIFGIENAMQEGIGKNSHFSRKTLNCS